MWLTTWVSHSGKKFQVWVCPVFQMSSHKRLFFILKFHLFIAGFFPNINVKVFTIMSHSSACHWDIVAVTTESYSSWPQLAVDYSNESPWFGSDYPLTHPLINEHDVQCAIFFLLSQTSLGHYSTLAIDFLQIRCFMAILSNCKCRLCGYTFSRIIWSLAEK